MQENQPIDYRSLTLPELSAVMADIGEKPFRAKQLYRWMHVDLAQDFSEMTNLSKALREKLKESGTLTTLSIEDVQISKEDGTRKYLFRLPDGEYVESVLMRYHHGNSVCISSQVGCRMGCKFCASTLGGLKRSLTPAEMLEQIYRIQRHLWEEEDASPEAGQAPEITGKISEKRKAERGKEKPAEQTGGRISNIVVMGIGEPLDNYDNLLKFLRMLSDENGLNISQRNLTVSTCGIVPKIRELAKEDLQITLAISLHAPDQKTRESLMPIAKKYEIHELLSACRYYFETTGRRLTFEYSLVSGQNDSIEDAVKLSALLKGLPCHVNLIPVNPVRERGMKAPDAHRVAAYKNKLEKNGINATIRRELGRDIDGACGQLRGKKTGILPENRSEF